MDQDDNNIKNNEEHESNCLEVEKDKQIYFNKRSKGKKKILNFNNGNNENFEKSSAFNKLALNSEKLDDAMQELINICQLYDDEKLTTALDTRQKMISGVKNDDQQKNQCDISKGNLGGEREDGNDEDFIQIEQLQQKQIQLQSQLDVVLKVSKRLESKQKHKLKCIFEDEDDIEATVAVKKDSNANESSDQEDEDELIEFQQIENELRISELNRQLDKIQEELHIRLYRRLLSNTNSNKRQTTNSDKQQQDRRGSQTDESSPTSSTYSESETSTASKLNSIPQKEPEIKTKSIEKIEDTVDGSNKEDHKSLQPQHIYQEPQSNCEDNNYEEIFSLPPSTSSGSGKSDYQVPGQSTASLQPLKPPVRNSSINSDLERIDEDEENENDDDGCYLSSEHFRSIYEEKLSPIMKSNIETYQSPRITINRDPNNRKLFDPVAFQQCLNTAGLSEGYDVSIRTDTSFNTTSNNSSFNSNSTRNKINNGGNRPLTLYLPKPNENIDLVDHIQALGHDLKLLSNDLQIDINTAQGYLYKSCSSNSKRWLKRYFYFDRNSKVLEYYNNESQLVKKVNDKKKSIKPRHSISFDSICDVYVDHKLSVIASEKDTGLECSSGKKKKINYVFVLSTSDRKYLLSTSKAELMRVWIDVLFTAAKANDYFQETGDVVESQTSYDTHNLK